MNRSKPHTIENALVWTGRKYNFEVVPRRGPSGSKPQKGVAKLIMLYGGIDLVEVIFRGKSLSKNKRTSENAVARIYGS